MDHLNLFHPWTRLTSLGGVSVLLSDEMQETPALFLCCDSLTCSAALMQLCHAERLIPSLPVFFPDTTWARQQKAGMAPIFRGWDCGRGHCSFLLLKAWDELRGSLLPGLPASAGSVLRLGRIWMEQFLVPHVSLGSFIPANPCITP